MGVDTAGVEAVEIKQRLLGENVRQHDKALVGTPSIHQHNPCAPPRTALLQITPPAPKHVNHHRNRTRTKMQLIKNRVVLTADVAQALDISDIGSVVCIGQQHIAQIMVKRTYKDVNGRGNACALAHSLWKKG